MKEQVNPLDNIKERWIKTKNKLLQEQEHELTVKKVKKKQKWMTENILCLM